MTYSEVYHCGREKLEQAGVLEAALDAGLLLEHVCGGSRNDLFAHGDALVTEEKCLAYEELINQRSQRIPLQQLTGVQYFMGLEFLVDEHVLIPRQDTEILVEEALKNLHDGMRVLDLCTGSGCILISLLRYSNGCQGLGTDISREALAVAEKNARILLGEEGCTDGDSAVSSFEFIESDLFEKVEGTFDMIISNPPYIPSSVVETLMPEVRDHEPRLALDGSEDGLMFYRRITQECGKYLTRGGMLFFEIGYDQAAAVSVLMEKAGFLEIQVIKDYAGMDRVVFGTLGFDI